MGFKMCGVSKTKRLVLSSIKYRINNGWFCSIPIVVRIKKNKLYEHVC